MRMLYFSYRIVLWAGQEAVALLFCKLLACAEQGCVNLQTRRDITGEIRRKMMGYAVELYFDRHTEEQITRLRRLLKQKGTSAFVDLQPDRPHISLATFTHVPEERLLPLVRDFAAGLHPIPLQLGGIGTFPDSDNVLFLIPVPSVSLLRWHGAFSAHLNAAQLTPNRYHQPGNWIPHCTLEMNLPAPLMLRAMESLRTAFQPLQGQICEIGVVRYHPVTVLKTWKLGSG
jgi:2'-5' RNA ligase